MSQILPKRHQVPLPLDRLILDAEPDPEAIEMDVLFVGAGPAGLSGAIELANLVRRARDAGEDVPELSIGVLEKAESLGEHCLSGAVVNPVAFLELFPDTPLSEFPFRQAVDREAIYYLTESRAIRLPTPPTMRNHGNWAASLCEIVRWLGERAEAAGVNVFTGFPVDSLLVEGDAVRGVRTTPSGLDRQGQPGSGFTPPTDLTARVTALSEGTRGALGQAWCQWQKVGSPNPQVFALGVKEVWRVAKPLDRVIHTMGWPLPTDAFGGSFFYPMGQDQVAVGLVVGLDYHEAALDVHEMLQRFKLHPLVRPVLEGGELLEWGAKTIPEGGWYALPERRSGAGLLMVGDTAGFVDVPSLKGIHYAMQSGILAARAIFDALRRGDASAAALAAYDRAVNESFITRDMHRTRNMRLAFKDGFWAGAVKAGLMTVTGGRVPGSMIAMHEDAEVGKDGGTTARRNDGTAAGGDKLVVSKLDAVYKSGNATRDTIPSHLLVGRDVSAEVADFYTHLCPAGVYERDGETLRVNPPNCVDCKATDVLGPRWTPREAGSGPKYRLM